MVQRFNNDQAQLVTMSESQGVLWCNDQALRKEWKHMTPMQCGQFQKVVDTATAIKEFDHH